MSGARALAFDFNGTLSDDEPLLFAIFSQLFAELGRPLSSEEYLEHLVGLSDPEIVRIWLGEDHPERETVLAERVSRYRTTAADGSTVRPEVREAVLYAAEHVPVAVVSGALRAEVEPVLAAAGLSEAVVAVVTAEDVQRGKPDPECYLRALALVDGGVRAEDVTAFEDTEAGVAAAKAAGMRCVAVLGTLAPERLALADELAPALNLAAVRRALGESPPG
ncbi:MAG: HAD family phosphatase [Actinomycetota bacterium]